MENRLRGARLIGAGLLVMGALTAAWAEPPAAAPEAGPAPGAESDKVEEAVGRARLHMEEAVRALGEAGKEAYKQRAPEVSREVDKALGEAERLLEEMRKKVVPKEPVDKPVPKDEGKYI